MINLKLLIEVVSALPVLNHVEVPLLSELTRYSGGTNAKLHINLFRM